MKETVNIAESDRYYARAVPKAQRVLSSLPSRSFLPSGAKIRDLLAVADGADLGELLKPVLLDPICDLIGRPRKKFRAALVALGYGLVKPNRASPRSRLICKLGGEAVELIHAGSLVIDDIEDGSLLRRGQPALHHRYGLSVALNAGNWLYFWPLEIIKGLGLPAEKELLIYRYYQQTLLKAHYGQALDVGLHMDMMDQKRVAEVCLATIELKTGVLVALALIIGAILGGASRTQIAAIEHFGLRLGVALQMFDDLGNIQAQTSPSKRFEDLAMRRPSWIWAFAARHSAADAYRDFVSGVRTLPESRSLIDWIEKFDLIAGARNEALAYLEAAYERLERAVVTQRMDRGAVAELRDLGQKISTSYD